MEGRSQPVDPEGLFADWLGRSGAEAELDELCREHGEHASTFRRLHAELQHVRALLRRAGLGIAAEQGHSFALRLKEQYGSGVDPAIALERGEEQSGPASSQLLKRLAEHSLKGSRYQLKGELARGGMGAILKVWDEDLRRSLAMKVILGREEAPSGNTPPVDKRLLARFLEEAQVTGQLDHPGIVPVHELGIDAEGRVYFTMKLVKGRDLKTIFELVFEGREGWNETRALGVILKVCEAMAYAHAKGVVHRDLKPANVMVGNFGEVYVMDWGLARVLGREDRHDLRLRTEGTSLTSVKTERREERSDSPDSPILTMDGDIVGTPAYMPPEQARGEVEKIGPHSDVYAIGAVLYHLLARQMPYVPLGTRVTNRMILVMVVQGPPPALTSLRKDIPAELVAICEKAMARESITRYRDTIALAEDLRAYLERRVVKAYGTGALIELRKWIERNKGLAAALAAAFVILVGGVVTSSQLAARARGEARRAEELAAAQGEARRQAQRNAEEAGRLRDEAVLRETEATERANALWAIEELKHFKTLDDDLEYARSQDRPAYVWWLEQAHVLVDGRPPDPFHGLRGKPSVADHRRLLERICRDMIGQGAGTDREKQWWNTHLSELVHDLEELRVRIVLAERSVNAPEANALWSEAIEAIARSEKYAGLRLTPQLELLPLGPDPDSGLWEFAHLGTGEPALRGGDGRLVLKPETGIVFVLVPSGRVPVGEGLEPTPMNHVLLDAFFLSKYEMTVAQWHRTSPWTGRFWQERPLLPANNVSWDDCQATLEVAGAYLRLPTETQWEYGCRAGTTTPWWTGYGDVWLLGAANIQVDMDSLLAAFSIKEIPGFSQMPQRNREGLQESLKKLRESLEKAWGEQAKERVLHFRQAQERSELVPVGLLSANPFGLHDVHGNVAEWCCDEFGDEDLPVRLGDGQHDNTGSLKRVVRGGNYGVMAHLGCSNYRLGDVPAYRFGSYGLRVARSLTP